MPIEKNSAQNINMMSPAFMTYPFMMAGALRLNGLQLLIFAFIFSFWVSGKMMFASNEYLANYLCYRRESVNRALKDLVQRRLIIRMPEPTQHNTCRYTVNENTLSNKIENWCDIKSHLCVTLSHTTLCDNITPTCDKKPHPLSTNVTPKCDKKSHNTKDNKFST